VDGLQQVDWEPFRSTYVKPGAALQAYDKVWVQPVIVSYKTPPRSDARERHAIDPNYALPASAVASLERYFHDAFVKALGKRESFTVVEAAGADDLRRELDQFHALPALPPLQAPTPPS
jgi:hypothetical protein